MFKNGAIILITLSFSLASLLSGCNTASDPDIYWFRDPVGFFHTNDLERAQEEIPFTIILPSYLPENMGLSTLKIYGPIKIDIGDYIHGIQVDIDYISGDKKLYINEDNTGQIMHLDPKTGSVILNINGIRVLRQKAQSSSVSGIQERLSFYWNHGQLCFIARFYSIDADEAIKVVQSMIEQME